MADAYGNLHELGFAHSAETWQDGELVGGLYGVSLGQSFFGESMFADRPDASKVAFVVLVRQLARWGFDLIDCQVHTDHLARFGAQRVVAAALPDRAAALAVGADAARAVEARTARSAGRRSERVKPLEKLRAICSASPTHWCARCAAALRGAGHARLPAASLRARAVPRLHARYGRGPKEVLLLGMNPGAVRDGADRCAVRRGRAGARLARIDAPVGKPEREHPKRPDRGLRLHAGARSRASGSGASRAIASRSPSASSRASSSRTTARCSSSKRAGATARPTSFPPPSARRSSAPAIARCARPSCVLRPRVVVGVGHFAESRARKALAGLDVAIGRIPHPSPASPDGEPRLGGASGARLRALGDRRVAGSTTRLRFLRDRIMPLVGCARRRA